VCDILTSEHQFRTQRIDTLYVFRHPKPDGVAILREDLPAVDLILWGAGNDTVVSQSSAIRRLQTPRHNKNSPQRGIAVRGYHKDLFWRQTLTLPA
jgi:hypothetical protein